MATLKDVARLADVDPSTVSRVLRGDPVQAVRPETRDRILAASQRLHYRPNALARGLRTRRTDTLGLSIPSLENVGFSEVTHGIQAAAAAADRLVVVVEAEALERAGGEG
nr:LacI family DNA-binding transcriptional regulator [Chloroflexota bacterium]